MKWKNKGHEFEQYKNVFTKEKRIYIYGAGVRGKYIFSKLKAVNCVEGFIDNSVEKQGTEYKGKPIYSIMEAMKRGAGDAIVIVAVSDDGIRLIMQQMRTLGFEESVNLFRYDAFEDFYLQFYMFYAWNKLYFSSVGLTLTTVCNLRCKGCLAFIPHNKNPKMYEIEMFKLSVDNFFKHVDYVDVLQLSGGETFLYPNHEEIIEYIGQKYRDRIGTMYTTTNGTIIPSKELLKTIRDNRVTIILDDYTKSIPENKERIEGIVSLFEAENVLYVRNVVDFWIDLAPTTTDNSHLPEEELVVYYGACSQPWIELYDNNLYSCNYAQYAMRAGLIEDSENDRFSLVGNVDKQELLEFRNGYTEKGYVDTCKKCAGYLAINKNIITPAEQER